LVLIDVVLSGGAAAGQWMAATGQIHLVIHALGVLLSLPFVLEGGEVVERLSHPKRLLESKGLV
jgi:hypothetical protein